MNTARAQHRRLRPVLTAIYFLLPLPIAWLSLSLMSMHAKYYDVGINMAANNNELVFLVAPVLLFTLYTTAATCLYLANKFSHSPWLGYPVGGVLMISIGIGLFLAEAEFGSKYSIDPPKSLTSFFEYYLGEMAKRISIGSPATPLPSHPAPAQ